VINPYARQLTFLDTATRTRRDHEKYLTLIASIALLHQYQRPVLTQTRDGHTVSYIEVTPEDIAVANTLAHAVLGRSLDELAPQTRRLLGLLYQMVCAQCQQQAIEQNDYRFSRRQVRDYTGWGQTQVQLHLQRLVDLEYLLIHRGQRGQSFVYELLYRGEGHDGAPFVLGLLDPATLPTRTYEQHRSGFADQVSGAEGELSAANRPQIGPISGGNREDNPPLSPISGAASSTITPESGENAYLQEEELSLSYVDSPVETFPSRRAD
jgi:hypothetical protein